MSNYKCHSVGIIGAGIQGVCIGLQLIKKGIPEKKSYIVKFPSNKIIPNNLMSHFLRGVFDGDGDVGNSDRNTGVKITSASLVFLEFACRLQ